MCFDSPLISVVMGVCYQRESLHFLKRSVDSILAQNYSNLEFLICENNSVKGVRQYLQTVADEDSRVRLIDGKGADTLAAKLNRCIKSSRGDYVARQDDDDVSAPDRLKAQMTYLEHHPMISFVGCIAWLEQDGVNVGCRTLPEKPQIKDFLFVQPFLHPTLVFRKEIFKICDGYCENVRCAGCEDYDMLLRLYQDGFVGANMQTPYFTYTLPPKGRSNRTWRMRLNEVSTRWKRFQSLGILPGALPYVIKPVVVGLIPQSLLWRLKEQRKRYHEAKHHE